MSLSSFASTRRFSARRNNLDTRAYVRSFNTGTLFERETSLTLPSAPTVTTHSVATQDMPHYDHVIARTAEGFLRFEPLVMSVRVTRRGRKIDVING